MFHTNAISNVVLFNILKNAIILFFTKYLPSKESKMEIQPSWYPADEYRVNYKAERPNWQKPRVEVLVVSEAQVPWFSPGILHHGHILL